MNDLARISKRAVDFLFDRPPRNEDSAPIWVLGQRYDSPVQDGRPPPILGTSPSATSDGAVSHADSAIATAGTDSAAEAKADEPSGEEEFVSALDPAAIARSMQREEEEDLGWPAAFLDDFESRVWMTYRSGFPAIAKSADPAATAGMSFATKMRALATSPGGFTSDTGWGCMIRSGQSLLANTLLVLRLGREWRCGAHETEHRELLSLFADAPDAPFALHRFVAHGAQACGTYPGQWFGPSATARCIRALTDKYPSAGLRVYARPNDSDVYVDTLLSTASQLDADDQFQPTLILLGIRLGIENVTPAYHSSLRTILELPQSVGIAGGRPSSSHYFVGHQGDAFFYLDPHYTRPALSSQPQAEDVATCHTRRVRRLGLAEMDPSMLLGFFVRDKADFDDWRRRVEDMAGKAIIHVHETEPSYGVSASGNERPGAELEVETLDEDDDDLHGDRADEEEGDGECVEREA